MDIQIQLSSESSIGPKISAKAPGIQKKGALMVSLQLRDLKKEKHT